MPTKTFPSQLFIEDIDGHDVRVVVRGKNSSEFYRQTAEHVAKLRRMGFELTEIEFGKLDVYQQNTDKTWSKVGMVWTEDE